MGVVYRAIDTDQRFNQRRVAVKEMSRAGLSPERAREAEEVFKREAQLLLALLHPHLPRIYDFFSEMECSYLVMDFIEGHTLADALKQAGGGPLPLEQALGWGEQLCDVLHYLHTHQPPIIFRDLKPSNVMISASGHLFLIDFGIARFFRPGQAHDTVALGSPGYAAPEQYGKAQSEPRSDIYGLGALLHHLLTGLDPSERPFFFRPAAQVNPAVPAELEALLQQMVEMESEKRPSCVRDVWLALQRMRASLLTSQPPRAGNPGRRAGSRTTPARSQAPRSRVAARPAAPIPGQKSAGPAQRHVLMTYDEHAGPVRDLAWSPDGKCIASVGGEGHLRVWNAASGYTRFTGSTHYEKLQYVAWDPRNTCVLAAGGEMRRFIVWNARNGERLSLACGEGPRAPITALAFSPADGTRVATGLGLQAQVALWSIAWGTCRIAGSYEGHNHRLHEGWRAVRALAWSPDGSRIASAADNDPCVHAWNANEDVRFVIPVRYRGHREIVTALAWSPDGSRIASADRRGVVQIWEACIGAHLRSYSGHASGVCALTWSPDGKHVASAGEDGTVQVWKTLAGAPSFTHRGHAGAVHAVAWCPDGSSIASGGSEGTVQVWKI